MPTYVCVPHEHVCRHRPCPGPFVLDRASVGRKLCPLMYVYRMNMCVGIGLAPDLACWSALRWDESHAPCAYVCRIKLCVGIALAPDPSC